MKAKITVTLVLRGPFLTKASAMGAPGIDAPLARDAQGRYYLPGTLVKGKLLEAWRELAGVPGVPDEARRERLLGKEPSKGDWGRYAAILRFDPFVAAAPREGAAVRTTERIQIDGGRRAVRKGFIQFIEAPYLANERIRFDGLIRFSCRDRQEAEEIQKQVACGLGWVDSFGAGRTIGYGELLSVRSELQAEEERDGVAELPRTDQLGLSVAPQGPFCVTRHRPSTNEFESTEVIAGGVLKGTLASMINRSMGRPLAQEIDGQTDSARGELCRNFHLLRFTHAFPVRRGEARPLPPPLSVVHYSLGNGGRFRDLAHREGGLTESGVAPAFSVDWKFADWAKVRGAYGWPDLATELRVRTKMSGETRRAEDEKLFSYRNVVPGDNRWQCRVDLSAIPAGERQAVRQQLAQTLARGFEGLGKTKVTAGVEWTGGAALSVPEGEGGGRDRWRILLMTPALLTDPRALRPEGGWAMAGSISRELQFRAYHAVWRELSGGHLELVRYFHDQSIAGGEFLRGRFQDKEAAYWPYLLTEPGSLFVVRAEDPAAGKELLGKWLTSGLPLPGWVDELHGRNGLRGGDWRCCPFVPANGYGEIFLNPGLPAVLAGEGA